jgi:tellurite resistance protein TerC
MDYPIWLWAGFVLFVISMLTLDLGVFHRKAHVVTFREAAAWCSFWVSLALLFNLGIFLWRGKDAGTEFLTGYIIELSLSVDNVFVWLVILSYFAVPAQYQHRVLFLGILGAIVMRGVFIAAGVTLLDMFHWLIYIFGAFLIVTGIKLVRRQEEIHPERNPVLRLARRFIPVTSNYEGQHFFIRRNGKLMATPLFMVLLVVEATDLVFATDSVPAILAITRDPFIIWTSNVFAILGLRALFFLVGGVLRGFRYLNVGLALALGFVGMKMVISGFYKMPTLWALCVVVGILGMTMLLSHIATLRERRTEALEGGVPAANSQPHHSEAAAADLTDQDR